jgi:hypothetical protein
VPSYQNHENNLTSYPTDRASHASPLRSEIVVSVTSADDSHLAVAKINIFRPYIPSFYSPSWNSDVPASASSNLGARFSPRFTPHLIACESSAPAKIMSRSSCIPYSWRQPDPVFKAVLLFQAISTAANPHNRKSDLVRCDKAQFSTDPVMEHTNTSVRPAVKLPKWAGILKYFFFVSCTL